MKKLNNNLSSIIRVLLMIVVVSYIVNTYVGKGNIVYTITEGLVVICSIVAFILAIAKDIIKDRSFKEEWA